MWARNLTFLCVVAAGLAGLAGYLFGDRRPVAPRDFRPQQYAQDDFRDTVAQLDAAFHADWDASDLVPASSADDLTLCRRLSLGLTGTIPSLEEIREIEAQPSQLRVSWWLSRLFEDRRYSDYLAERLARSCVGTENGPFLVYRRRRFVTWLADALERNIGYDQLARQLISETGLWTDHPAVNFVTVTLDENNDDQPDVARLARRVSRTFLGVRLDCVQCHDDQFDGDWLQTDFHGLAAFFSGAQQTFQGIQDSERPYEFKYLDSEEEVVVPPKVPFGQELFEGGGPRRAQLARWVTHPENRPFARTAVNRLWALLFGQPLLEDVDNVPLAGPYPPGLEILVDDFVAHRFDLQRLIRVIAASEVFRRDSRADHEITPVHEDHWAAFPLVRLRPEQIAGSLLQATSLKTIDAQSHIVVRFARSAQQDEFVRRYGDTGEDEFGEHGGTIPQRLLLMNGNLVKERTEENLLTNASTRIAALAPDDATAVETAFLSVLTRRPTAEELRYFTVRLEDTTGESRNRTMEDVYWSLLNSTEFSWNH